MTTEHDCVICGLPLDDETRSPVAPAQCRSWKRCYERRAEREQEQASRPTGSPRETAR